MPISDYQSKIPLVDTCCLCFDLEKGTLILGWVGLVVNILSFIGSVLNVGTVPAAAGQVVLNIFYFLLYGGLLYGVYKKRPSFVLVWLVVNLILCCLLLIEIIMVLIYLNIPAVVFGIIFLIISLYFELVVYSYYIGATQAT